MENLRFKFRAWIPNTGWLAEGFSIAMDGTEWYDDNGHSWPVCDLEIMQFTGLKDKNGKEIYEGDIVRYYVSAPWDDEVPLEVRAEVMFDDPFYGCFCVKSREGHMDATGCLYEYIHGIEVIGNIYEHKHLLQDEK